MRAFGFRIPGSAMILLACVLLGFALRASAELVAHYTFEGSASDGVGGHHGTVTGAPAYVASAHASLGQAISFEGLAAWIEVPDFDYAGAEGAWTISLWVKGTAKATASSYFFSHAFYDKIGSINFYGLSMAEPAPRTGIYHSVVRTDTGGTGRVYSHDTWPFLSDEWEGRTDIGITGNWHMLTLVFDPSGTVADRTRLKFYVDGALAPYAGTGYQSTFGTRVNPAGSIFLGRRTPDPIDPADLDPRILNGMIDDLRIYSHALSDGEVAALTPQPSADQPIVFTAEPVSQQVVELQPVTFSASVIGTPPHFVQWSSNAVAIAGADQLDYTIQSATMDMDGTLFAVTVSNLFSSATSSNAVLRVAPLRLDPIAHWTLDDGAGTTAADASGNGHDATLVNGPVWASGIVSNALVLDEVNDHLRAPDFDYGTAFTVSFWFRAAELEGNGFQYIFSHAAYNTAHSVNIYLGESSAASAPDRNQMLVTIRDSNDTAQNPILTTSGPYNDDAWHLCTLTVAPGSGGTLYMDGQPCGTTPNGGDGIQPAGDLFIGGRQDLNATRFYGGLLDDLRVYDRALSPGEVLELFTRDAPPFRLEIQPGDSDVLLSWPAKPDDVELQRTSVVTQTSTWTRVEMEPGVAHGRKSVTLPKGASNEFFRLAPPSAAAAPIVWGNAAYVDFAVGQRHEFMGKEVELLAITNDYATVAVDGVQARLRMARRDRPAIVNGIRLFVADTQPVARLTTDADYPLIHALTARDALLCLSDPARPLLDPARFTFPISREDGYVWTMDEDSGMFAYLLPTRSHEGADLNMHEARGQELHGLQAVEDGTIRWATPTGSANEACLLIESAAQPGIYYVYQHLNVAKLRVQTGDTVTRGQLLGFIWGDWQWGHLHFSVVAKGPAPDYAGRYRYLLNTFPQLYELWHGSIDPVAPPITSGQFRFAEIYYLCEGRRRLHAYTDTIGYGWLLGDWCAAGKVDFRQPSGQANQSAQLRKVIHTQTGSPATNPNDWYDFEVRVENGNYLVSAEVGDAYSATAQRVEFEGEDAGSYELASGQLQWTSALTVPVSDGRLTVRIHLQNASTSAGLRNLHFQKVE